MSSSSSACNIAAKRHGVNWKECCNCARHVGEAWRAVRRGWCGDGRSCHGTPLPLPVGWSGPAGSPLLLVQLRAFCPYGPDQLQCGALVHLYELRSHISANTHALSAGPLTSVYDSPVVVEDYSALVQGRNCVQQVEGAQIPLRLQLRKIPLSYLDNLNLS